MNNRALYNCSQYYHMRSQNLPVKLFAHHQFTPEVSNHCPEAGVEYFRSFTLKSPTIANGSLMAL